jgi:hypothetical protein
VEALLGLTLGAQLVLFGFTAVSMFAPEHRIWPPPSRHSWQFFATWFLSWVSLGGAFLLAVLGGNSLGLPIWLRLGLGVPLFGLGAWLAARKIKGAFTSDNQMFRQIPGGRRGKLAYMGHLTFAWLRSVPSDSYEMHQTSCFPNVANPASGLRCRLLSAPARSISVFP